MPEIPQNGVENIWIIGFGQFGQRAAEQLIRLRAPTPFLTAIDVAQNYGHHQNVRHIQSDGVNWLVAHFSRSSKVVHIIPALPVHLAAEWITSRLAKAGKLVSTSLIPDTVQSQLPNPFRISPDSIAVSHANFLCPPDCSEPKEICTVTRKPRPEPMYRLLGSLRLSEFRILTIRSRQLAPGVGGFTPQDLWDLHDQVCKLENVPLLLCSACRCHGIISSLQFTTQTEKE